MPELLTEHGVRGAGAACRPGEIATRGRGGAALPHGGRSQPSRRGEMARGGPGLSPKSRLHDQSRRRSGPERRFLRSLLRKLLFRIALNRASGCINGRIISMTERVSIDSILTGRITDNTTFQSGLDPRECCKSFVYNDFY